MTIEELNAMLDMAAWYRSDINWPLVKEQILSAFADMDNTITELQLEIQRLVDSRDGMLINLQQLEATKIHLCESLVNKDKQIAELKAEVKLCCCSGEYYRLLQDRIQWLVYCKKKLTEENESLRAENESLRCCRNCKHEPEFFSDNGCCVMCAKLDKWEAK